MTFKTIVTIIKRGSYSHQQDFEPVPEQGNGKFWEAWLMLVKDMYRDLLIINLPQ